MRKEGTVAHTFHIPVMGTGYTIDTPIKVAHYGITSVISIIDHRLVEQMRRYHCEQNKLQYTPIHEDEDDSRAKIITAYLNLVDTIVNANTEKLKNTSFEPGSEITKYFEILPDTSALKREYNAMLSGSEFTKANQDWLKNQMVQGEVQVNIMTKIDKTNYTKNSEPLPAEYNDAHAALRGFANSKLNSSLVLSAGLNPRLFGYLASFDSFLPDSKGQLKKKIILKVSDYRSAMIQGKFLAKKGVWISEFRIESGLNCGGHAFATDGYLLGPILKEFKDNKDMLINTLFEIYSQALTSSSRIFPNKPPEVKITVQGGVGTYEEHQFLMDFYNMDSVGWGSPFLLVPEVVNIDKETMELIARTDESGFYLSNVSPLGVPFNNIKGTSGELEKQERVTSGKPGAACIKKHLLYNTEFSERPICTASTQYQQLKIEELTNKNLSQQDYKREFSNIVAKECLCVGLGNATLLKNNMEMYRGIKGATVCPGPNMAYFSEIVSLKKMVDHIYGKVNIIKRNDRPHMFIKEIRLYIDYLKSKTENISEPLVESQVKYYNTFQANLNDGINYYKELFSSLKDRFKEIQLNIQNELSALQNELNHIKIGELVSIC